MSAVAVDTSEEFVAKAVPLLKEYATKVGELKVQLRRVREESDAKTSFGPDARQIVQAEYNGLKDAFARLRPAIRKLTQQVSGMVDQGDVTPLARVELQLRLAELESLLDQMPKLILAYQPKS